MTQKWTIILKVMRKQQFGFDQQNVEGRFGARCFGQINLARLTLFIISSPPKFRFFDIFRQRPPATGCLTGALAAF